MCKQFDNKRQHAVHCVLVVCSLAKYQGIWYRSNNIFYILLFVPEKNKIYDKSVFLNAVFAPINLFQPDERGQLYCILMRYIIVMSANESLE